MAYLKLVSVLLKSFCIAQNQGAFGNNNKKYMHRPLIIQVSLPHPDNVDGKVAGSVDSCHHHQHHDHLRTNQHQDDHNCQELWLPWMMSSLMNYHLWQCDERQRQYNKERCQKEQHIFKWFLREKTANFPRSLLIPCALTSASGSFSFAAVKTEPKFQVCLLDVCTIFKERPIVIFFKQTCIVIVNAFLTPAFHSPLLSPSSSTEWMQSFRLCTPSLALEPGTACSIESIRGKASINTKFAS